MNIRSLGHYIFDKLDGQFRDKIIFVDASSGRQWTGLQLKEKILNVATALKDLHEFEQGTTVCISYKNSDITLILALAIISLGGTVANAFSKDPYVEPKYLFCHKNNLDWALQLEADMGYAVTAIAMDELPTEGVTDVDKNCFQYLYNYQHRTSKSLKLIPTTCEDFELDIALVLMSSGTTGKPKAIPVTHLNCVSDMMSLEQRPTNRPNDIRFACSASLDYVSGRLIMFGSIAVGYTSVILDGFEPRAYLEAIMRYKINIVYLGAASFYNLITYKDLDRYDISSLKIIFPMGAKIIYLNDLERFFEKHPHIVQVKQGFGASELSGGAMKTMTPHEYLTNAECCGQLLPGMKAKLVDPETGLQVLESNKRGILHMKGPTMFPGYYDVGRVRRGESDSPFIRDETVFDRDGFYITGDVAYFNEDQELFIVGRLKELMCCRAGKKVLPQELEEVIEQHEAVSKVCVLAIPHQLEKNLHCPRAFIVPKKYTTSNNTNSTTELEKGDMLKFTGTNKLCRHALVVEGNGQQTFQNRRGKKSGDGDELGRRALMTDLMNFVDERVGWEKQLTGGLVLIDDMPTLRETGKVNKSYLRSLTLDQVEIYGDRSNSH